MLFYMADPNSTTGLIFHENLGPGGPFFSWNIGPLERIFQDQNSPDRTTWLLFSDTSCMANCPVVYQDIFELAG